MNNKKEYWATTESITISDFLGETTYPKEVKKMNTKPVQVSDILNKQECVGKGKFGDGIFKYQRFVIVAPNTEIGQKYKLKIIRVMEKIAFAEVIQ